MSKNLFSDVLLFCVETLDSSLKLTHDTGQSMSFTSVHFTNN